MLADQVDVVIGVDTHLDRHVLALVDARSLLTIDWLECEPNRAGYRRVLRLVRRRAPGGRVFAVEGTGSYGAGLARRLEAAGERVLEVERPKRQGSRGRLKSDRLDAERAARSLLGGQTGGEPRRGAERDALRALLVARNGAVQAATAASNELRALVLTSPDELRARLQQRSRTKLVQTCAGLQPGRHRDPARAGLVLALRSLGERVRALQAEERMLTSELARRVRRIAPGLLAQHGVGPISAAIILVAWSHRGRLKSEAAFARLAGAAPIPASSGKTLRHRLDRGGDRRLNRALHTIILCRLRADERTRAYIARRQSEGKTKREAIRCLKRYLARSLFRLLEARPQTS